MSIVIKATQIIKPKQTEQLIFGISVTSANLKGLSKEGVKIHYCIEDEFPAFFRSLLLHLVPKPLFI